MQSINVYLSGEIHSQWRQEIIDLCKDLPLTFASPSTDHEASDGIGAKIVGEQENSFWSDHVSAKINTVRNRHLIEAADIVVVRFGEKYRQWNAAFDAGFAAARGKSLVVIHDSDIGHALKEVDAAAHATVETPAQAAQILRYAAQGATGN